MQKFNYLITWIGNVIWAIFVNSIHIAYWSAVRLNFRGNGNKVFYNWRRNLHLRFPTRFKLGVAVEHKCTTEGAIRESQSCRTVSLSSALNSIRTPNPPLENQGPTYVIVYDQIWTTFDVNVVFFGKFFAIWSNILTILYQSGYFVIVY